MNNFVTNLKELNFKIFRKSNIDTLDTNDSNIYILNIAQIQIEEYIDKVEEKFPIDSILYIQPFEKNAVNFNCWLELIKSNSIDNKTKVLFSSFVKEDNIDGSFTLNLLNNEVKYKYTRNNISLSDINEFIKACGKKNAEYLFDYFMNCYVNEKSVDKELIIYYHYNKFKNKLEPAYNNRFIEIEK